MFQQLGAISGALSIGLGAYGSHGLKTPDAKLKQIWSTAVHYQQIHSIVLVLLPTILSGNKRGTLISGSLFGLGTLLFSGACYGHVLSEGKGTLNKIAPYGGVSLIAAWLSLAIFKRI